MELTSHSSHCPPPSSPLPTSPPSPLSFQPSSDGGDHSDVADRDSSPLSAPLQYETVGRLQEGHSGISVMLVRAENGTLFARKVRSVAGGVGRLKEEFEVMRRLHHPNVVRGYAYSLTEEEESILMEFCDNSDLHSLLATHKVLSETAAKPYFLALSSALLYCHSHNIAHLDLKPENCFLTTENQLKLGDFGFSSYTYEKITSRRVGTHCYNSPEELLHIPFDGKAADVFSLGMILFQMVAGFRPFAQADSKSREFKRWINSRDNFWCETESRLERSMFQRVKFSEELKALVGGMMELQPKKRWRMGEVVDSEWLRSVHSTQAQG